MKPKDEVIKQAQAKLEKVDALWKKRGGGCPFRQDDYDELKFLATGFKIVESPIEPYESNRSFFHLKDVPCGLFINGTAENGKFSHEDYAPFYTFERQDGSKIYFRGGASFKGKLEYMNYQPTQLYLYTKELPTSLEVLLASGSLTSSCL
jgi:hypothetical protein